MSGKQTLCRIAALIVAGSALAGCASMDQGECETANWYDVGRVDGENGTAVTRQQEYGSDCAEFGVRVDTAAYRDGWEDGIVDYCTRDNGYRVGIEGESYENSCPAQYRDTFFSAYQLGRAVHTSGRRVDNLRDELEEVGDELARGDLGKERRTSLARKRRRLKDDLEDAEFKLFVASEEARRHGFTAAY